MSLVGTPNDGSRAFYFNAAKAKWRINENHNVDFVYITNQFQDKYLPTWRTAVPNAGAYYNNKKILNASDEKAFMVYGRDKLTEKLLVEPYYIVKREEDHPLGPATAALDLNTAGAALFILLPHGHSGMSLPISLANTMTEAFTEGGTEKDTEDMLSEKSSLLT